MFKRALTLIFIGIFFSSTFASYAEPLPLEPLLEEAKKNNPAIEAAAKRYEAAKARIPQAKSLDDPVIGVGFQYTPGSPFQLKKTPSQERMLSISQFLPFFGKLTLKGKIALVESQMLAAEYKNKQLEVINQVKNSYYGLFRIDKEIELNGQSVILLEDIAKAAEARYITGSITQEELFKITLEISRLSTDIANLEQERGAKGAFLNSLLNRKTESALGKPELSEGLSFVNDINLLDKLTLENQPELLTFSYAVERNKHAKALAKKSFFPDLFATIAERGITTGTIGPWDLMFAFTLPLWFWTKQRYQVKEAIANLEEAEAAYQAMKNRALAETRDLAAKVEIARKKILLYKNNQIPLLESSIESLLSSYRAGKADIMMLLDSERMLVETKMNYFKALVEYNASLADLERSVGMSLTERFGPAGHSDSKRPQQKKRVKERK